MVFFLERHTDTRFKSNQSKDQRGCFVISWRLPLHPAFWCSLLEIVSRCTRASTAISDQISEPVAQRALNTVVKSMRYKYHRHVLRKVIASWSSLSICLPLPHWHSLWWCQPHRRQLVILWRNVSRYVETRPQLLSFFTVCLYSTFALFRIQNAMRSSRSWVEEYAECRGMSAVYSLLINHRINSCSKFIVSSRNTMVFCPLSVIFLTNAWSIRFPVV